MSRKPRIHYSGAIYHVMLRGNHGDVIFFSDADREHFLFLVHEGIKRYNYRVHAFCLMSNHVHFAIQVEKESLSKIIQNISFRYTRWINKKLKRVGHLFQGRFKAILVDEKGYLLCLVRYIHLNPVRAHLVQNLAAYYWSSHSAYLGLETFPWVTTHIVLNNFSSDASNVRQQYQKFLLESDEDFLGKQFKSGNQAGYAILAGDHFMEELESKSVVTIKSIINLEQVVEMVCALYSIEKISLKNQFHIAFNAEIRASIAWIAQEMRICNLTTVAKFFDRNPTSISRILRRLLENEKHRMRLVEIKDAIEKSVKQA